MSNNIDIPRLLAPIHIDALAVGSRPKPNMFQWTNLAPDFAKLQTGYLFGSQLSAGTGDPLDEADDLEPGIHLHFRLPRALTHGSQDKDDRLIFPPIPNRWLVQRFYKQGDDRIYTAWLIKSDVAPDDKQEAEPYRGVTWPTFNLNGTLLAKIGASAELTESLQDEGKASDTPKLTAIGPGNPAFSAYYPACRGVLGFHDPLTDIPATAVSYLVTGWYSNTEDDPLTRFWAKHPEAAAKIKFEALQAWAKERFWDVDGLLSKEGELPYGLPSRLLCHGLVTGIDWQGPAHSYWQPTVFPRKLSDHENAYKVAVGNTAAEALAALLKEESVGDQDFLTALQADMLSQRVSSADLHVELHERRFGGVQGGTKFLIRQTQDRHDSNRLGASPTPGSANWVPEPLRQTLNCLNILQERCDHLARRVEDCRWLLYALWYQWTSEQKKTDEEPWNADADREQQLNNQLAVLKTILMNERTDLSDAEEARDAVKGQLETDQLPNYPRNQFSIRHELLDEFTQDGLPSDRLANEFQLHGETFKAGVKIQVEPADNGWTIVGVKDGGDPEVLYHIKQIDQPKDDSEDKWLVVSTEALKYRLATSIAKPFQQPNDPNIVVQGPAMGSFNTHIRTPDDPALKCRISGQAITGEELTTGWDLSRLDDIHHALLHEALLLSEQTNTSASDGTLPEEIANFHWRGNPWIPLYLVWEVEWESAYSDGDLTQTQITRSWTLAKDADGNMGGELIPIGNKIDPGSESTTVNGYSLLTPSAAYNLAKRLLELDEGHPLTTKAQTMALQQTQMAVRSQILDGFHKALTLHRPGMQLPPLDFAAWSQSGQTSLQIDPIHTDLYHGFDTPEERHTFRTAPVEPTKPFLPIRAGQLTITTLSIVDAFGQTLKVPIDQINASAQKNEDDRMLYRGHACVADQSQPMKGGKLISLRPRFTQPTRLRFEGVQASAVAEKERDPKPTQFDPEALASWGISAQQLRRIQPVCGWIVPNRLDQSLTIYAATGEPLGALQKKLGSKSGDPAGAYYWVDVPGVQNGDRQLDEQARERWLREHIEDTHLRYFCTWVLRLDAVSGGHLSNLIEASMDDADLRVPDEDPGVSILVGRPLALVRADLQFEASGLPAHRPELRSNASGSDKENSIDELIDTGGFEQVCWPLRLGDHHARNDGLIGLFKCSTSASGGIVTNGDFYPVWGKDADKIFKVQNFEVSSEHPLQVTMLMDPQARVHATTGVLPRTFFELPHESATGAKRAREVFFQTAPVLGLTEAPHMPKPSDDYGEWSWAYRPPVTPWTIDPNIVEATDRASFSGVWPTIAEGWLKLAIAPVKVLSFWVREGDAPITAGSRVHLAWSLQGAESVKLEAKAWTKVDNGKDEQWTTVNLWTSAPFPRQQTVMVNDDTVYRLTARTKDAETAPDRKEITVKIIKSAQ